MRNYLNKLLILPFLLFAAANSLAQECTVSKTEIALSTPQSLSGVFARVGVNRWCQSTITVSMEGAINRHTVIALETLYNRYISANVGRFVIGTYSPGGDVQSAAQISRIASRVETLIPDGKICASACATIFASGKERHIGPNSLIGIHSAYFPDTGESSLIDNLEVAFLMQQNGVDYPRIIEMMNTTPGNDMIWINAEQALSLGLADSIHAAGGT